MSSLENMVRRALMVSKGHLSQEYFRYYLRERIPEDRQYVSEGVVALAPDGEDQTLFATQLVDPKSKPLSVEEYYEAILRARLPARVLENERKHNPPVDAAGQVLDREYSSAVLIAQITESPIVASVLYRATGSTELLVELMSLQPMRPSDGLKRLKERIRSRLAP